jgi:hypothetical protein
MMLRDLFLLLSTKALFVSHILSMMMFCLTHDHFRRQSTASLLRLATKAFATIAATT